MLKAIVERWFTKKDAVIAPNPQNLPIPQQSAAKKKTFPPVESKDEVPGGGHCTAVGRVDWCKYKGIIDTTTITREIQFNPDPNAPLYYWQLYSIMGPDIIREVLLDFYKSIFADTEELWFRDHFASLNDVEQHTRVQAWYWSDAFGGGSQYLGGESRISFHHEHNGNVIMTGAGARRWMHHMANGLINGGHMALLYELDKRIFPTLVDFLRVKMNLYAQEFNWAFDPRSFDELDRLYGEYDANPPDPAVAAATRKRIADGKALRDSADAKSGENPITSAPAAQLASSSGTTPASCPHKPTDVVIAEKGGKV